MVPRRAAVLLYRTFKGYFDHGGGQLAASISYFVLLSIFPLLIFTTAVIGIFLRDEGLQQDIVDAVVDNIPLSETQGRNDVAQALRDVARTRSGAIGAVGLLTMFWTSSSMFGTVRYALAVVFGVQARPLVPRKALDLLMVLLFAPFFGLSIAATTVLRVAQQESADLPVIGEAPQVLGAGWLVVSFLLPMAVSFVGFFGLYWLVPRRGDRVRYLALGALFGALLFEVIKLGLSLYIENFTNYDFVFGSLGAVVAFLFWVYLSASALLLGGEMAAISQRVLAGEFDYDLGGRPGAPRRTLRQKAGALLLSLVVQKPPASADASRGQERPAP